MAAFCVTPSTPLRALARPVATSPAGRTVWFHPRTAFPARLPVPPVLRGTRRVTSMCARSDSGARDEEFELSDSPLPSTPQANAAGGGEPQNELFEFVKSVPPPELVARFADAAPPVVQKAIRQTIVTMLGSLPIGAFSPSVQTVSANLVQLFHSSLISGYMFRNAAYRLELTRSLGGGGAINTARQALPAAENTGPEIRGGVAVFKGEDGKDVEVPVEEYVESLKEQVSALRDELVRERKGGNELLSFISTLEPENLEALTKNAGEEVVEAMKRVVGAVTSAQQIPDQPDAVVEASSFELGQLLFYLMVSGFFLREAEVRVELQRSLGGDARLNLKTLLVEGDPGSSIDSEEENDTPSDDEPGIAA